MSRTRPDHLDPILAHLHLGTLDLGISTLGPRDVDFYILICLNDHNLTCLDLSLVMLAGHFFPRSNHEISTLGVYFSNSCLCPFSSCCELVFISALWTSIFHFHVGPNFEVFLHQNSVFNFESEPRALGTSIFPF